MKSRNLTTVDALLNSLDHTYKQKDGGSIDKRNTYRSSSNQAHHHHILLPELDKDEMKKALRLKYRQSWRDAGYTNKEFQKVPILKAKVLNNWEMERINLSKRSYDYPKDFKGIKIQYVGREFPSPQLSDLPEKTQKYIVKMQEAYKNALYDPAKTLQTYDSKMQEIRDRHTNVFKRTNTIQNNSFGFNFPRTTTNSFGGTFMTSLKTGQF